MYELQSWIILGGFYYTESVKDETQRAHSQATKLNIYRQ